MQEGLGRHLQGDGDGHPLINSVGEVGQHCDKVRGGGTVSRDEAMLLRVEYVVCDEDSSFMVRIMNELP